MVRSSSVLTAGKLQFASPADFVNHLASFRVRYRPNKYHWLKGRPWVSKSIAQLEREIYLIGCQKDTKSLIEYQMSEKVKLLLDCEFKTSILMSVDAAFRRVQSEALEPLLKFILAKTGKRMSVDELAIEEACRQIEPIKGLPTWKQSFHVIFPMMRLVGTFNDDPQSLLRQFFPTSSSIQHPLHHHVFTFLTGDECDITNCIPTVMLRALPQARTIAGRSRSRRGSILLKSRRMYLWQEQCWAGLA